jgi:hypothetical protein
VINSGLIYSSRVASTKNVENPAFVDQFSNGKPWAFHIPDAEETHKGLSAFEDLDRGYLGGKPLRWIVYILVGGFKILIY